MNITDIDDKIIKRARQNYLFDRYKQKASNESLDKLLEDQRLVLERFQNVCTKNTDPDKKVMLDKLFVRMNDAVEHLTKAVAGGKQDEIAKARDMYLQEAKDPISDWLDSKEGASINDNAIFEALPRYWEDQFHNDMQSLNVSIFRLNKFQACTDLNQFLCSDFTTRCFDPCLRICSTNCYIYTAHY